MWASGNLQAILFLLKTPFKYQTCVEYQSAELRGAEIQTQKTIGLSLKNLLRDVQIYEDVAYLAMERKQAMEKV